MQVDNLEARDLRLPGLARDVGETSRRAGDFDDQFVQDGVGKGLVALRRDHERAGPADDIVAVVAVEVGLEREDRQAVDADAGGDRLIARRR